MHVEPDRRQMKVEADRVAANTAGLSFPFYDLIPRDEAVAEQSTELYRPPSFLRKTALPGLVEDLAELLHQLWEVNQELVGEKVLEVEAYYAATGEHRGLEERFRRWCDAYFRRRADPGRL